MVERGRRDNWMRARSRKVFGDFASASGEVMRGRGGIAHRRRSVYRLVALLEHLGWLAIQRTSGRLSNQYVLLNPANPDTSDRVTPDPTLTPVTGLTLTKRTSNPDKTSTQPCQYGGSLKERTTKRTTKGRESDSGPDVASRVSKRSPAKARPKANSEIGDSFERFWAVYPRKVNEDDARAAFAKAIKSGADIDTVVARAACYAVERADAIRNGDLPKWTPYAATWLKKRKWNDPPPDEAVIDEYGNVVAVERPRRREAQNPEEIIAEVVAMYEDDKEEARHGFH
jgi:hypothetical protein